MPGEMTDVEVTISTRQDYGEIVHETVVQTEPAAAEPVTLRTTVRVYPALRVEALKPMGGATVLRTTDGPQELEFQAITYHSKTASERLDLDKLILRSAAKVRWLGPKRPLASTDELDADVRVFSASVKPDGPPGQRAVNIALCAGSDVLLNHVLRWESIDLITPSPKLVVVTSGKQNYRVTLRSSDQKPFRVMGVECEAPGFVVAPLGTTSSPTHAVELTRVHSDKTTTRSGKWSIKFFTDNPDQKTVVVDMTSYD
jgi:hypothetical protein